MNNGSFRTYGYSDPNAPDYFLFEWNLVSQDKNANTSTISWKVTSQGGKYAGSYIYIKEKYVSVNGERQDNNTNTKFVNGTIAFNGTTTIQHNQNGDGTFGANCGGAFEFSGRYNSTGSGNFTLPKIPRAAQFDLSSFEDYDRPVEDEVKVKVIIGNPNYYSELSIRPITQQSYLMLDRKAVNGINILKFTQQELNDYAYTSIPGNSEIFLVKMDTYTDEQKTHFVGSATGTLSYLALITNANPVFNGFNYKDIYDKTKTLTGNDQRIILGKSTLQVIISEQAIARKRATMQSYNIGNSVLQYTGSTITKNIYDYNSESIKVSAVDSRGNSTSITKNLNTIRYFDIIAKGQNIVREDGVGEKTTISFNGEFWNGNFGAKANTIRATYKYRIGNGNFTNGTTPLQISTSGNSFNCNQFIIGDTGDGFNISNSYEIIVTLQDELSSKELRYTLIAGEPAIAVFGNKVALNGKYDESKTNIPVQLRGDTDVTGKLTVNGKPIAGGGTDFNKIYPVGSIYMSINSTNPNSLFGGTWERLTGGFLYGTVNSWGTGNGTGTTTNSGGSGNTGMHALTIAEMPSHTHTPIKTATAEIPGGGTANTTTRDSNAYHVTSNTTNQLNYTGGSQGHKHTLPGHSHNIPYIAVFIWRRTR